MLLLLSIMLPTLLKPKLTLPVSPRLPPYLLKLDLTSAAVLFLLFVNASTIIATPSGPYPSYLTSS